MTSHETGNILLENPMDSVDAKLLGSDVSISRNIHFFQKVLSK